MKPSPYGEQDDRVLRIVIRWTAALWLVAFVAVCVRVTVQTDPRHKHSGYFTYYDAGKAWRNGGHLYTSLDDLPPDQRAKLAAEMAAAGETMVRGNTVWGGFRYSPTAALLFSALTYMPMPVGEIVWRALLATMCLGALYWCCRLGLPRPLIRRDWPIIFILIIPAYTGCLSNGQCSCVVLGCLLGTIAACQRNRWTLAAVLIVLATTLKLYPVALGLVLCALYPRQFSWRFAIAMVIAFALPFVLRPGTMLDEHRRWWWHLVNDAKMPVAVQSWDQDIRLLLYRVCHVQLSARAFLVLQGLTGLLIAAVCVAGQRAGWPRRLLLSRALGLTACWMTVLGSATEPSTYILIAPTLAWSLWETSLRQKTLFHTPPSGLPGSEELPRPADTAARHGWPSPGGAVSRRLLMLAYALFLTGYIFLWFPKGKLANSYAPEPLGGVIVFGYLLIRSWRELRRPKENSPHATLQSRLVDHAT